jgi:hypothetical protein
MDEPQVEQMIDYEAKARESGWASQAEFKGNTGKWIDAKSWVERGEQFIPFLRTANRELKGQIENLQSQLTETRRTLQATTKAITELKEDSAEQVVAVTKETKTELMEKIAQARADNDVKAELQLMDQLADVNETLRAAKRAPVTSAVEQPTQQTDYTQDPVFQRFLQDNPWFREDQIMAGAAVAAMGLLNSTAEGKSMTPEQRFNRVAGDIKRRFGMDNQRRQAPSKVEGSRAEGTTGGGGTGRSFEDLPSEAKQQCDQLSRRFVGKINGKGEIKYKDLASYRTQYANDYFAEDWGAQHLTQQ